jgi:hypothetical protein
MGTTVIKGRGASGISNHSSLVTSDATDADKNKH